MALQEFVNDFSAWVGLLLTIPVGLTYWELRWGKSRRHHGWLDQVRNSTGNRPAILLVDLLPGKDVKVAVERYRANNAVLKDIPDERFFVVCRQEHLKPDDTIGLVKEIQDVASEILKSGADIIHYFYAGPVFASAMVGAEFSNASCQVLLYQNDQGNYINFGPLRHPRF